MSGNHPILVTDAAGRVGGVGSTVVERLRQSDFPVRAMVHREDERSDALRAIGAEVVVGERPAEHRGDHRADGTRFVVSNRRIAEV